MLNRRGLFLPGFPATVISVLLIFCHDARCQDLEIPASPADDSPVADYAELLDSEEEATIGRYLLDARAKLQGPVRVVTIPSLAEFGADGWSFERFAYTWKNKWMRSRFGILFLFDHGARRIQIQLGNGWGSKWKNHCKGIERELALPLMRRGDFSGAVLRCGIALVDMAKAGPDGRVPGLDPSAELPASTQGRPPAESSLPAADEVEIPPVAESEAPDPGGEGGGDNDGLGQYLVSAAGTMWLYIGIVVVVVVGGVCLFEWLQERKKLRGFKS